MERSLARRSVLAAVAALLLGGCSGSALLQAARLRPADLTVIANDIPPRLQWNANFGYCGETSLVSAALYYGTYLSQYTARALASPGIAQSRAGSQLLLGVNAGRAARALHLTTRAWQPPAGATTAQFLTWVKRDVAAGFPVIIGVYNNEYLLYGKTDPNAGDPSYDHIVPVNAIVSHSPRGDGAYDPRDAIRFSDNGLYTPNGRPTYIYTYAFGSFAADRAQANAPTQPIYSLPAGTRDYGLAVTGIDDPGHETLPVRIATSTNAERPAMRNGSNRRPTPEPLRLTVTVSGLHAGASYEIYRYDTPSAVPNRDFNARAGAASQRRRIVARGATFRFTVRIVSDATVVYRAVPADGP